MVDRKRARETEFEGTPAMARRGGRSRRQRRQLSSESDGGSGASKGEESQSATAKEFDDCDGDSWGAAWKGNLKAPPPSGETSDVERISLSTASDPGEKKAAEHPLKAAKPKAFPKLMPRPPTSPPPAHLLIASSAPKQRPLVKAAGPTPLPLGALRTTSGAVYFATAEQATEWLERKRHNDLSI